MQNKELELKLRRLIEQYRYTQEGFYTASVLRSMIKYIEILEEAHKKVDGAWIEDMQPKKIEDWMTPIVRTNHTTKRNQEFESIDWAERN